MENQVEAFIRKGQWLCHVAPDNLHGVALPLGHKALPGQLLLGVIQHGAHRAPGAQNGDLLPAAAGQAQHPLAGELSKPAVGHRAAGRENHVPLARLGPLEHLMADGDGPGDAVPGPLVPGCGVDVGVAVLL